MQHSELILDPLPRCLRNGTAIPRLELLAAELGYSQKRVGQDGLKTPYIFWENPDLAASVRQTVGRMDHDFFRQFFSQEREGVQHLPCVEKIRQGRI